MPAADDRSRVCPKLPDLEEIKDEFVLEQLEEQSNIALKWFEDNYMKMNSGKCHLIVSGNKYEQMWAKIGNDKIWESRTVKLLGITIDNELKFDEHIDNIWMKAQRKLSVLLYWQE